MQLTDGDIAAFQDLYEQKFGRRLDAAEALAKATALVGLMQTIIHPTNAE